MCLAPTPCPPPPSICCRVCGFRTRGGGEVKGVTFRRATHVTQKGGLCHQFKSFTYMDTVRVRGARKKKINHHRTCCLYLSALYLVQGALFTQNHRVEVQLGTPIHPVSQGRLPRILILLPRNGRKHGLHTKGNNLVVLLMPLETQTGNSNCNTVCVTRCSRDSPQGATSVQTDSPQGATSVHYLATFPLT